MLSKDRKRLVLLMMKIHDEDGGPTYILFDQKLMTFASNWTSKKGIPASVRILRSCETSVTVRSWEPHFWLGFPSPNTTSSPNSGLIRDLLGLPETKQKVGPTWHCYYHEIIMYYHVLSVIATCCKLVPAFLGQPGHRFTSRSFADFFHRPAGPLQAQEEAQVVEVTSTELEWNIWKQNGNFLTNTLVSIYGFRSVSYVWVVCFWPHDPLKLSIASGVQKNAGLGRTGRGQGYCGPWVVEETQTTKPFGSSMDSFPTWRAF